MKIYLSPSRQPANTYAYGGANEQGVMTSLATRIKPNLERLGHEVRIAPESLSVTMASGRVADAKKWGADIYMPLHSNAGGDGRGGQVYLGKRTDLATKIATAILARLKGITPHADGASKVVYDNPYNFAEIRNAEAVGLLPIYLEVEFHDKPDTAKWILESLYAIAKAIAEGIDAVMPKTSTGVGTSAGSSTSSSPTATKTIHRVQVGAYSVHANAIALRDKLIAQGHPSAYIVSSTTRKTNAELAAEVRLGLWGNGEERKRLLTEAGVDYSAVQALV